MKRARPAAFLMQHRRQRCLKITLTVFVLSHRFPAVI